MSLLIEINEHASVGELAAEYPVLIPLFEEHLVEFGCGAERSLAEECARLKLSSDEMKTQCRDLIQAFPSGEDDSWKKWNEEQIPQLIEYILNRFHEGHRAAFPKIEDLQERALNGDGGQHPDLITRLCMLTQWLFDDIRPHMLKEEQVLFPAVFRLLGHRSPHGGMMSCPIQHPIAAMEAEHEVACNVLREIRALTHEFTPPEEAAEPLVLLFEELKELVLEIHRHIHLENNVLFPMILRLSELA